MVKDMMFYMLLAFGILVMGVSGMVKSCNEHQMHENCTHP